MHYSEDLHVSMQIYTNRPFTVAHMTDNILRLLVRAIWISELDTGCLK